MEGLSYLPIDVRTVSTTAASLTSIEDARSMLYVAIGVERPYSFAEWRAIQMFMDRGGQVLVADDFGYGNSLLRFNGFVENPAVAHIGDTPVTEYEFSGKRLSDIRVDRNPQLVRLTVPIWEGLEYEVLLNDPSCFLMNDEWYDVEPWISQSLLPGEAQIIANCSESGWIDNNRDGVRDPGERVGEFPVIIYQGGMLLISDPSMFTNDMYERYDNRVFIQTLVTRLLPDGGTVIFDESIHVEPGLFSEVDDVLVRPITVLVGENWPVYSGLLVLVVGTTVLFIAARRALRKYAPHKDLLGDARTMDFGHPYNWLADYYEVRGVLLQRMRYAYGLDPDDLQRLPPEMVARLLGDQYLVQFVLQPLRVDPMALDAALTDIAAWQPPPEGDHLVKEAEGYLASLPVGTPVAWSTPQWAQGTATAQHIQAPAFTSSGWRQPGGEAR
jgi:hypothetical protein